MSAARRSTLAALTAFVALAVPDSPTAASQPAPSLAAASPARRNVVAALRVSPQAPELKARPALVDRLRDTAGEVVGKDFPPGLRGMLLQATRTNEHRIRETIDELAEATVEGWMAFRQATAPQRSSAVRSHP